MGETILIDTDYAPNLATDIELDDTEGGKYLIVYSTGEQSHDLGLSIVPDTEKFRALIEESGMKIVAHGESDISLASLIYGLNHPARILYKSTMQDIQKFLMEKFNGRFEEDDRVFRKELNKIHENQ